MLATEEALSNPPSNIPMQVLQILRHVWADKTIQPQVKTFAWRLLRLALGTACRVHGIIPAVDDKCSRCGSPGDDNHLFFGCNFARAVWFASPIGLRADALPQTGHELHSQITTILQQGPSQATAGMIFSIMWCLWKARNDHRFNKSNWTVTRVLHEAKATDTAYNIALETTLCLNLLHMLLQIQHLQILLALLPCRFLRE